MCDNLFMKSRLYIEDDTSTAQLLNGFAPVQMKKTAISGALVFIEYNSLDRDGKLQLKTDYLNSSTFL